MIPLMFIDEWRQTVPWPTNLQIEQDMIISHALIEIYSQPDLVKKLAFKGGTALHKIHFDLPGRYSEDLDFVQIEPEPIGATLDSVRAVLDPWLGKPRRELQEGLIRLEYRVPQEGANNKIKLKLEINSREHFSTEGLVSIPFKMQSRWYTGNVSVTTLEISWLLGSKLLALYGRRKSRDLFDLWLAIKNGKASGASIVEKFLLHIGHLAQKISRAEFEKNMFYKLDDPVFIGDLSDLIGRTNEPFNIKSAYKFLQHEIVSKLPGEPWKGAQDAASKGRSKKL